MMITELDRVKCQNSFDMIDGSGLEMKTKSDLKEALEESLQNLNGRTLEERCASIARNQFDSMRFICDIIIQFKAMAEDMKKGLATQKKTSWKDVIIAVKWPACVLGGVLGICSIFSENIVELIKAMVAFF